MGIYIGVCVCECIHILVFMYVWKGCECIYLGGCGVCTCVGFVLRVGFVLIVYGCK